MSWLECSAFILPLKKEAKAALEKLSWGKNWFWQQGTLVRTEELVQIYPLIRSIQTWAWWEIWVSRELQKAGHTILMVGMGWMTQLLCPIRYQCVNGWGADISKQMSDILLLDNRLDFFKSWIGYHHLCKHLSRRIFKDTVVVNSSLIGFGLFVKPVFKSLSS